MFRREKDIKNLINKTSSLSSSAFFWRRLAHDNPPAGSLPQEKELETFLNEHRDIECLQDISAARMAYDECIENDYEDAVRNDQFFRPDPCMDRLHEFFNKKETCLEKNSFENKDQAAKSKKLGL